MPHRVPNEHRVILFATIEWLAEHRHVHREHHNPMAAKIAIDNGVGESLIILERVVGL